MLLNASHLVIATDNVKRAMDFFRTFFDAAPHFENDMFGEFVLPGKFRVAFFKPVGASAKYFQSSAERGTVSFGVTTKQIDELYRRTTLPEFASQGISTSGPPKEHPWGEKSFLLIDPDGNRWEITESPTDSGMLTNRPFETGKSNPT